MYGLTMIRPSGTRFDVTVSGAAIYLDNWAIYDLAEGDSSRRSRFVAALCTGSADLLFSVTNAGELTGPKGRSRDQVRTFLDELGPHWFPVELNATDVVLREQRGANPAASCVSKEFLVDYWSNLSRGYGPGSGKIIDLSEFLRLGAVLDWVGSQSDSIRKGATELGDALANMIGRHRAESDRDPKWLDQHFPRLQFNPSKPAMFTYVNLVRTLILEAKSHRLNSRDGMDFCHAVIGTAFAHFTTLDKNWQRRVASLPPHALASVYNPLQLDQMVADIELTLKRRGDREV